MAYKPYNSFSIAQAQFDGAAQILDLDPATRDLLRQRVVRPEHLEERGRGHATGRIPGRAVQKAAAVDAARHTHDDGTSARSSVTGTDWQFLAVPAVPDIRWH